MLRLSPRQQQIVRLLCTGLTNDDIAAQLEINVQTVKNLLTEARKANQCRNSLLLCVRYTQEQCE